MARPRPVLLMVRELGIGGTERQLAQTAMTLDRSRFEPHVACFWESGFRGEELRAADVPIVRLPVRSFASWSAAAGALQMGRYLRLHGISLVHTFDVPMNLFGVPAARFFRTPVVISSQRAHRSLTPGWQTQMLRVTDRLVDAIVVNSLAVARELTEESRVPASLIHLWRNSIDLTRFYPGRRRMPQLADASLVIGVVCALRPEKSLETLLDAFAQVRNLRPGLKLAIVGDGPEAPELKARSEALGLSDACWFFPAASNVPEWLRSIDIFVLPSRSEAFSNSLMEAMACGCCAVASDAGGNPELVTHNATGMLFPVGDADTLAQRLAVGICEDEVRERLAAEGAAFLHDNFSVEAAAQRISGLYESLLNNAGC